jgi:hypothetical protein
MDFLKKKISQKVTLPILVAYLLFVGASFLYVQDVVRAEYTWKPVGPASSYIGLVDTPNTLVPNALQFAHPTEDEIIQSTNLTFDGVDLFAPGFSAGSLVVTGGAIFDQNLSGSTVGIGTLSPSAGLKLDVAGRIGATEYCDANGANCIAAATLGGDGYIGDAQAHTAGGALAMGNNNISGVNTLSSNNVHTSGLQVDLANDLIYAAWNSGKVGINTDAPTEELHVIGDIKASGWVTAGNVSATGARFDTDTLYVDWANDRVGINTTTPQTSLDVVGHLRTTGNLLFNGDIRPDGDDCANGQILKKTASANWDCVNETGNPFGSLIDEPEINISNSPGNHKVLEYNNSQLSWTAVAHHHLVDGLIKPSNMSTTPIVSNPNGKVLIAWNDVFAWDYISGSEIVDGSITNVDLQNNTIETGKLQNDSVTSAKIDDRTITANDIKIGTITKYEVGPEALIGDNILDGSINAEDVNNMEVQERVDGTCYGSGIAAVNVGGSVVCNTSDINLKNVLGEYTLGLDEILQLQPVEYSFKENNIRGFPSDEIWGGFVAQEVQDIIPAAVSEGDDGYLDFRMNAIVPVVVNAIQEQQEQIDQLKKEIDELKNSLK